MRPTEHFVTLFDSAFLPMGVALHQSLTEHAQPFHLWVICMDVTAEEALLALNLRSLTPIPLREVERADARLPSVKAHRSRAEYCWTISPFSYEAVFSRDDSARRVTYLDADVFFFADPRLLLSELDESGRHILITEHAFDPRYDLSGNSGRFCVQFFAMDRSHQANRVIHWWQDRVIESCSAQSTDGKFGDQKYVDQWPDLFGDDLHILRRTDRTLAPWNVRYVERRDGGRLTPTLYHFHGLRIFSPSRVMLYTGYRVGPAGRKLYDHYLWAINQSIIQMRSHNIPLRPLPPPPDRLNWLRRIKWSLQQTHRIARL